MPSGSKVEPLEGHLAAQTRSHVGKSRTSGWGVAEEAGQGAGRRRWAAMLFARPPANSWG